MHGPVQGVYDWAESNQIIANVQVPEDKLPQYKEYLEPLLNFGDIPPIHTTEFKDGRRIPTLVDLLEEARDFSFRKEGSPPSRDTYPSLDITSFEQWLI